MEENDTEPRKDSEKDLTPKESSVSNEAHTEKKAFSCVHCEKSFPHKGHLVLHQRTHVMDKVYSCSQCEMRFPRKANLVLHEKTHTSGRIFSCTECEMTFTRKTLLVVHRRIHAPKRSFSCTECEMTFPRKTLLVVHRRIHAPARSFNCTHCERSFPRKTQLVVHQRAHTAERLFTCTLCEKTFPRKVQLLLHQRIHTGEQLFSCTQCGKSFPHRGHLVLHEQIHMGEKSFSCKMCHKRFNMKATLLNQRIHTHDIPFSCFECGTFFNQMAHLERHQRIHTGERPYSCSQCGKSFSQKGNLSTHQKIHLRRFEDHNINMHPNVSQFRETNHKRRFKTITPKAQSRPYSCKVCGMRFSRLSNLIKHQRNLCRRIQLGDRKPDRARLYTGSLYRKSIKAAKEATDSENEDSYEDVDSESSVNWDRSKKRQPVWSSIYAELHTENNLDQHTDGEILEAPSVRSRPVVLKAATFIFTSRTTVNPPASSPPSPHVGKETKTPSPSTILSSVSPPSVPLFPTQPLSDSVVSMVKTFGLESKKEAPFPHANTLK
ncbi:zinc finger protein 300-like [Ambystoma mexicanum]|uniref:zinc finger protein 300-like n=1 Tax=Ambystoma mexicanum TaxID=8296 RepID=UPI0037E93ED2